MEMLVALAVIVGGVLIAAGLLTEAQTLFARSGRDLHNPPVASAMGRVRHDVQGARWVTRDPFAPPGLWSHDPLDLSNEDGTVRLELARDNLERAVFDAAGTEVSRRVLLPGVLSWRWREVTPGLLDVEVSYRWVPEGHAPRFTGRADPPPPGTVRTESFRLALRDVPRLRMW